MNKNGWGLRAELMFIFLFLFCLLVSTIGLSKMGLLGDAREDNTIIVTNDDEYKEIERNVRSAALNYYNNYYSNGTNDTLIININTLYSTGYLSKITDSNGRKCKGYAKVTSNGNAASYINCSRYKTSGYQKEYE